MSSRASSNLLIVSDDPSLGSTLLTPLKTEYNVLEASNYHSAEEIIKSNDIDVAVVDIDYENSKNSFDTISYIKNANPDVPIVMLATDGDVVRVIKAIRLGATDYVLKGGLNMVQNLKLRINMILNKESSPRVSSKFGPRNFASGNKMRDSIFHLGYDEYVKYIEKLVLDHLATTDDDSFRSH